MSLHDPKPSVWWSTSGWVAWVLLGTGLLLLGNALWQLAAPEHWYRELPAGVPDFGPYNAHFVRDIGCAFLTVAVALLVAARRPRWRAPLVGVAALFFVLHAGLHVFDTLRGAVDWHHLALDFPGVYLPAIGGTAMALRLAREDAESTARR